MVSRRDLHNLRGKIYAEKKNMETGKRTSFSIVCKAVNLT